MKDDILVTITTVTLNSEKTIRRAIESVLNQTYSHIEYIIKDGGSMDATISIAESYKEAFKKKGYGYVIVSTKDTGMYDALNQANNLATGIIVGNVNSDDFFEPNAVETMATEFKTNEFDMAYANLRVITPKKTKIKKAKIKRFLSSRHWNHPTTFVKRDVLLKERYKCQSMYDDFDLMIRLRKQYRVVVINKVLSNFVFGGMSTKKNIKDVFKRIGIKMSIYKENGYRNPVYFLDTFCIELCKFFFGKK